MSTIIDATAVTTGGWRVHRSARRLADAAGRDALARCGQQPTDVDLLVNAGLYHDRNLGEPALAPLIQEDIGANPADPYRGGSGTFSFDVANGTAGVLTALQVVDGFLRAGTVTTALIVASDADPGHGLAPGFPFHPAGGAMVCHWSDGDRGLGSFRWCNRPDGGEGFRATVGLRDGRNVLVVEQAPDYAARLADAAAGAIKELLAAEGMGPGSIDAVLAAPGLPQMAVEVSDRTGIPVDRIVTDGGSWHTVGPIAAIDRDRRSGPPGDGRTVLLVAAGAGITAGAALYRT